MNLNFNKIIRILLICLLIESSEQNHKHCLEHRKQDELCSSYCYKVVKPLLEYASSVRSKELQFHELADKIHHLEMTTQNLKETIRNLEVQLEVQQELGEMCKKNSLLKEELLEERKTYIMDLQAQIVKIKSNPEFEVDNHAKPVNNNQVDILQIKQNLNSELQLYAEDKKVQERPISNRQSQIVQLKPDDDQEKITNYKENRLKSMETPLRNDSIKVNNKENMNKVEDLKNFDRAEPDIVKEPSIKYLESNCLDRATNIYILKLPDISPFPVACDSSLAGSGWTVVQRRKDGSEHFSRNWTEYQRGFGNLQGEFFIGLENLHILTKRQPQELYIYLMDFHNNIRYAQYNKFLIGSESESYKIKTLGEYSGNADDALKLHTNWKFSTFDRDNQQNCAKNYKSGWWFNDNCYLCNLNGPYIKQDAENSNAIEWRTWHFKPLKFVQMMIRPKSH